MTQLERHSHSRIVSLDHYGRVGEMLMTNIFLETTKAGRKSRFRQMEKLIRLSGDISDLHTIVSLSEGFDHLGNRVLVILYSLNA